MRYLSVCAGIEAATVAWHPLGWTAAAFSEIEPFPRAVLAHHWPEVPRHGDFTTIGAEDYGPIDLLVGGTPCQSFSVAGLRGGLDDDRGNLALEFLRLAGRKRPRWVVWENVPGVLSSNGGRDFGAILGGLVELGYGFAYRILDAQHFGVPQRRRRVFVVGYLGDWRPAAAVLFERHGLSGHPAPGRKARKDVAPCISARPTGGGGLGTDFDLDGGLIAHSITSRAGNASRPAGGNGNLTVQAFGGNNQSGAIGLATALNAHGGPAGRLDFESETFVCGPIAFHGAQDPDVSGDVTHPLGRNNGLEACIAFDTTAITSGQNRSNPQPGGPCHTLSSGAHPPALAFSCKDYGADVGELAPTMRAMNNTASHANGGGQLAVATKMGVRRLTPTEAERLQGFPDGYTAVRYRGKQAKDGPRYKALGNSMAVPVVRWIGERISAVERIRPA
jgi:DNA (cytosine-5)-methyltransferase 1